MVSRRGGLCCSELEHIDDASNSLCFEATADPDVGDDPPPLRLIDSSTLNSWPIRSCPVTHCCSAPHQRSYVTPRRICPAVDCRVPSATAECPVPSFDCRGPKRDCPVPICPAVDCRVPSATVELSDCGIPSSRPGAIFLKNTTISSAVPKENTEISTEAPGECDPFFEGRERVRHCRSDPFAHPPVRMPAAFNATEDCRSASPTPIAKVSLVEHARVEVLKENRAARRQQLATAKVMADGMWRWCVSVQPVECILIGSDPTNASVLLRPAGPATPPMPPPTSPYSEINLSGSAVHSCSNCVSL